MRIFLKNYFSNENVAIALERAEALGGAAALDQDQTLGLYCRFGNTIVGLFSLRDKLCLCVNEKVIEIRDDEMPVSFPTNGELCDLEVRLGTEKQVIAYPKPSGPVSTQFYSADEEDEDFGIWLWNVLSSRERRRIFLNSWANRNA